MKMNVFNELQEMLNPSILGPKALKEQKDAILKAEIDAATGRISNKLLNTQPSKGAYVVYLNSNEFSIKNEIKKAFEKVGWKVKLCEDQRDGIWLEFRE